MLIKFFSNMLCYMLLLCSWIMRTACVEYSNDGLNSWQNMMAAWPTNDINVNSTSITINYASFMSIPAGALDNLNYVEQIKMKSFYMTSFPDFCAVSSTLVVLYLNQGRLDYINPDYLDCLVELRAASFSSNKLTSIPDVPGPGSTLGYLYIQTNLITELPVMDNIGRAIKYLNVQGIPAVYPNGTLFDSTVAILSNMPSLTGIMIGDTSVTEFPDFSVMPELANKMYQIYPIGTNINTNNGRLYLLENLNILGLGWCSQTTLINPSRPWPSTGKIHFQSNPLNCDCRVRWMKFLPAGVLTIDTAPCAEPPGMVGRDWSTIDESEFVCDYNPVSSNAERNFYLEKIANTHYSFPPIIGRHILKTTIECAKLCMDTDGCMYMSTTDRDFPDIKGVVCDITSFYGTQMSESEYPINNRLNWRAYILY